MKEKMLVIIVAALLIAILSYSVLSQDVTCTFTAFDPNFGSSVSFSSPYPTNESWQNTTNDTMSIHVSNENGETMNISFHWANHTRIDYNDSVSNDSTVTIHTGTTYDHYQQYNWYANLSSVTYSNQSSIYWFKGEAYDWDINRDQYANQTDLDLIHALYLQSTVSRTDINGDGKVNYLDRSSLQHHWGEDYT